MPNGETKMVVPTDASDAAEDEAMVAAARDRVEAEIAQEDGTDPHYALGSLWGRLEAFMRAQPDVADFAEAGVPGYYGLRLAAAGDVSLVCQFTSGNTLADGTVA